MDEPRLSNEDTGRNGRNASVSPMSHEKVRASSGATPYEVVYTERPMRVRRYGERVSTDRPPVVLVYALFNRPEILDLTPDRSVVRAFLDRGRTVYLIDWGRPTRLDGSLGMDDYVDRMLHNAIRQVVVDSGHDDPHLIGYSTGGTLAALYASLRPEMIGSLSVVASPISFSASGGLFDLIDGSSLPRRLLDDTNVLPGDVLSVGFSTVDPPEFFIGRFLRMFDIGTDWRDTRARGTRLDWSRDSVDVPATVMEDIVEIFQTDGLLDGSFRLNGSAVDLTAIDRPVLAVVAERDRFVPRRSTLALLDVVSSRHTEVIRCSTDHLGLASEAVAFKRVWPDIAGWIAAFD